VRTVTSGDKQDLQTRTTAYALRIIRLYGSLPKTTEAQVMGRQLLRSGTSVGAHYLEATRARSRAGFVSKDDLIAIFTTSAMTAKRQMNVDR
jgi:hypothetical protein